MVTSSIHDFVNFLLKRERSSLDNHLPIFVFVGKIMGRNFMENLKNGWKVFIYYYSRWALSLFTLF